MNGSAIAMARAGSIAEPAPPRRNATDALQQALSIVRTLRSLDVPGREFAVTRDAASRKFAIAVRERETGVLVEHLAPEDALRLTEQLACSAAAAQAG